MLVGALVLSCAIHALVLTTQPMAVGIVSRDCNEYWQIAGNLLTGQGYTYDGEHPTRMRQPLYPLFLAAIRAVSGDSVTAVLVVQSALSLVTLVLFAALAARLLSARTSGLVALAVGLYVPLAALACRVLSDSLYIALLSGAIVCWTMSMETRNPRWAAGLGVLLGLVGLCRPAGVPLLVLPPLVLWLQSRPRRGMLLLGLGAALSGAVIMAPWGIRNYLVLGEATLLSTDASTSLWFGVHPMMVTHWAGYATPFFNLEEFHRLTAGRYYLSAEASQRLARAGWARIRADPGGVITRGLWKVAVTWTYLPGTRPLAATSPVLFRLARVPQILVLLLAFLGAIRSPSSLWSTALVLFLAVSAGLFLGPATARYVIPFMPLALLFAVAALAPVVLPSPEEQTRVSRGADAAVPAPTQANPD
jgi:4-amino-4-deoxy-L-arabinose transferase-like glycosyltransferase